MNLSFWPGDGVHGEERCGREENQLRAAIKEKQKFLKSLKILGKMVCRRKKRQKSIWKIYVLPRLLSKSQSGKVCHSLIHISPLIFGIFRLKSDIPMKFFF